MIRHFDGSAWQDLSDLFNLPLGQDFRSITALPSGTLFVEGGGQLFRGGGTSWQRLKGDDNVAPQRLMAVGSELYAFVRVINGYQNRSLFNELLARWDNGTWRIIPLRGETEPKAVWGTAGHLFVAGGGQQLFHFDGKGNIEDPAPYDDGRTKPGADTKLDF